MSRTLAGTTASGVTAPVLRPGFFVELMLATPLRLSTRGTITWNSLTWTSADVRVSGLSATNATSANTCTVSLGNTGLTVGTAILSEANISACTAKVWQFYTDAPALGDPVLLFSGYCAGATIPTKGRITIPCERLGGRTAFCPRTYINEDGGFTYTPIPGQQFFWEGETVRLVPEGF